MNHRCIAISFLLFLFYAIQSFAQNADVDSLIPELNKVKKTKNKIELLKKISNEYLYLREFDQFLKYADIGKELSVREKDKFSETEFLSMFADYYYFSLQFDKSIETFNVISGNALKLQSDYYRGVSFRGLSKNYWRKGQYNKAVFFGTEAVRYFENLHDTVNAVICKGNLGTVYIDIGNYDKAETIFDELVRYYTSSNDISALANTYEKKGAVKFYKSYYSLARKYYNESLNLYRSINKELEAAIELGNIGETFEMEKKYTTAIDYYKKAVLTEKKYNYYSGMIFLYQALGRSYFKLKHYSQAKQAYFTSLDYVNKIGEIRELPNVYKLLYELYAETGDFRNAYKYSVKTIEIKDSVVGTDVMNQINEIIVKYETEKKDKENDLLKKNEILKDRVINDQRKQNRNRLLIILSILLVLFVLLTGSIFLFRLYKKNKKSSLALEMKSKEINDLYIDITDSIKYAEKIQKALLSSFTDVMPNFSEYFIFNQPSEILGGDFYWSKMINDTIFFAAADSTGHGIPGALMSILGMSNLNEIVNTDFILPDTILNQLREKIKKTLNQKGIIGEQKDGWDISVCSLNIKTGEANYAGAFNSLFVYSNENNENPEMKHLTELKADSQPVSVYLKEKPFNNYSFKVKKGDILYFFTDGFYDQISEKEEKKFTTKRFKQLLLSVSKESLNKQKDLISQTFLNWKGNFEQVDDVLVIGIKI